MTERDKVKKKKKRPKRRENGVHRKKGEMCLERAAAEREIEDQRGQTCGDNG